MWRNGEWEEVTEVRRLQEGHTGLGGGNYFETEGERSSKLLMVGQWHEQMGRWRLTSLEVKSKGVAGASMTVLSGTVMVGSRSFEPQRS